MKTFRCSALPRVLRCPASQVPPEIVIESDNEAGRIGKAVHELLAIEVSGNGALQPPISEIATRYRVEADQIAPLFYIGKRIFDEHIRDAIEVIAIEQKLACPDLDITGTADIIGKAVGQDVPTIVIVDWKTGTPTADHRDQLMGYAALALDTEPEYDWAKIITVWIRDQYYEIEDIGLGEFTDWEKRLQDAREHPEKYVPGEACTWCPREHECKARKALVQSAATDFVGASESATVPATLASLYPQAKLLKKALDRYYDALKATIKANGSIPLGDGRQVGLIVCTRQEIGLTAALPVIVEELGSLVAAAEALKISKGKLTKLVGAQAERGQKGKAIATFMESLQEAGAIKESSFQKLGVSKIPVIEKGE